MTDESRTALITGGTSGIGLATARVLHERGYRVLVTGRNPDTLDAARRALPDTVTVFRADARSIADAERLAAELEERFGGLDLAFLNAGMVRYAPLELVKEDDFDDHFGINVKGQVFTLQKILPLLGEGSSVILTSSVLAGKGMPNTSIYSATKGAQVSLMRTLAVELAPRGIRVNAISPGPVDTPALGKLGLPDEALAALRDTVTGMVPTGRFGSDEEIAHAVAFLASPEAAYITGANVVIDGGLAVA